MRCLSVMLIILAAMISLTYGCKTEDAPSGFSVEVMPTQIDDAVPGQTSVFTVSVTDIGGGDEAGKPVSLSSEAAGATITIEPPAIAPGQTAEIRVTPDAESAGQTLTVTMSAQRGKAKLDSTATIVVRKEP